jgi:beta-glucanase (GH16 family)
MMRVTPGRLSKQYNTYGVLIGPETTSFYFDRELIWSTPTPPEYRQPMYMLVNLAIGGGWPSGNLTSPQIMNVQYIRVFQKDGKP